jgi:5-methylcytosine-specific restriction endonuclease McrA
LVLPSASEDRKRRQNERRSTKPKGGFINPPRRTCDNPFAELYGPAEWRAFSKAIIRERGYRCEDNEHEHDKPMTNLVADHIVELQDGGEPLSRANVMFRCRSCHKKRRIVKFEIGAGGSIGKE